MSEAIEEKLPDIYYDRVKVNVSLFGVNMVLGLSSMLREEDGIPDMEELITIRTSPIHAKILAMMLAKNIKAFEREMEIVFPIPEKTLETLELDVKDW